MFPSRFALWPLAALLLIATSFRVSPGPSNERRELPAFTAVSLGTSVKVVVHQGSPQQVVVEADPADLPKLQTEVVGGRLRIERLAPGRRGWLGGADEASARFQGPVVVYVTVPALTGLAVSGSGQLQADSLAAARVQLAVSGSGQLLVGPVRGRQVVAALSGSGQLRTGPVQAGQLQATVSSSGSLQLAQLRADSLRAGVSGSGSLVMAGACAYASLALSSSGSLRAGELAVQDCQARLSGSGSAQLRVARTLDAHLSSSGSLLVRGNPQVSSQYSGSGRVRLRG